MVDSCHALQFFALLLAVEDSLVPSQLTVRLPDDLDRALEDAAVRLRRKRSEIVRMALAEFLALGTAPGRTPADRVRGLIGSLESGIPDLAERQRAHLLDSLKHGR